MAELSKIFKSNDLYEAWRNDKDIPSNVLAVVLDETGNDVEKVAFSTNDITGEFETYEVEKSQEQPLQAVGYMFNDYIGQPMYDMSTTEEYPYNFLSISTIDGVTTFEGYIYMKYNRGLTEEEVTAEKAKITGDNIESSDIVVQQVEGIQNLLEIRWTNTNENMQGDTMTIYYDGQKICIFSNNMYVKYSNTAILMQGHTARITSLTWKNHVEVNDIVLNNESGTIYPVENGEYHIMIMSADYGGVLNFPCEFVFCEGATDIIAIKQAPTTSFQYNGHRGYTFDFQGITSTAIDNIQISFGGAYYTMNII